MADTEAREANAKPDTPLAVARRYFDAVTARDVDAMIDCWVPGGRENIRGQIDTTAPDGVRQFFSELFSAFPDFRFEVVQTTVQRERAVVRWRATGTFAGTPFGGIAATGARVELEGMDELTVKDGLIIENNAFSDALTFARQIGMLPPEGSTADQGMAKAFNAKTRAGRVFAASGPEQIADGVWIVRGGFPVKTMNVYLVRDGEGVLAYDAGISAMTKSIASAAAQLGGLTRVVLGHGHQDHRGAAPGLGVPVLCHPDNRKDAEGDGGYGYFDFSKLSALGRVVYPRMLKVWDGGPVQISDTLKEGDKVGDFEVIELPGHAPGLIGLWRASDRLALVSDCFYTIDPETGRRTHPPTARVPLAAFNFDTEQARASIRKLAALDPAEAWAGHAEPLRGDVRAQLEHAADTT
jgi:glyoxylase-like metal-dependent hydrolase (beta-lactamase superfamily II)/predicted ester cyclase